MPLPPPSAGSTSLVTGASSGIGAELARALSRREYGVTLVARRGERLEQLARELEARHGVRAQAVVCDLADSAGRDSLQEEVANLGLTVEVLCNNAGFGTAAPFVELERGREVEMLRLNCEALVDLCGRYAGEMAARGQGGILNVASTAAFQPLPGQSTYAASKALVLSFTEALHQELAPVGVAVSALCPGPVRTEFTQVAGLEQMEAATPSFLWADAAGVAEAGVQGLESGRRVVIPGALNRLGAIGGHYTPRALFLRAAARFYPVARR